MTQNPFDVLGGGFDMNALLQQAQQMQQQLEEAQAALAQQTVDGTVAGGAVTVTANGVGELVGLRGRRRGDLRLDDGLRQCVVEACGQSLSRP